MRILGAVLLVTITAVTTAAIKQRFSDGPNRVFSGGPLEAGVWYSGPEPDWRIVDEIPTIELQLLEPALSRRLWVAQHDGRLFVWSGYMGTAVGRMWKRWPLDAVEDGRAVIRIDGVRYPRHLRRITQGPLLDHVAAAVTAKYPSQMSRTTIETGQVWLFEAAPALEVN